MRVLMVDDDPFTRTMLVANLQILNCYVSVGASAPEAMAKMRAINPAELPEVALLDLDLGEGPTGIDLATALRDISPSIGIVILSTYENPRLLGTRQVEMPEGSIYLIKASIISPKILGEALQAAIDNMAFANIPTKTQSLSDDSSKKLPETQIEIMRLIAAGYSNAEIAKECWMSEAAVEKAIARLAKNIGLKVSKDRNLRVLIARRYYEMAGAGVARRI